MSQMCTIISLWCWNYPLDKELLSWQHDQQRTLQGDERPQRRRMRVNGRDNKQPCVWRLLPGWLMSDASRFYSGQRYLFTCLVCTPAMSQCDTGLTVRPARWCDVMRPARNLMSNWSFARTCTYHTVRWVPAGLCHVVTRMRNHRVKLAPTQRNRTYKATDFF